MKKIKAKVLSCSNNVGAYNKFNLESFSFQLSKNFIKISKLCRAFGVRWTGFKPALLLFSCIILNKKQTLWISISSAFKMKLDNMLSP